MATSITTRKGIAAAFIGFVLAACGGGPPSEISGLDAGEPTESPPPPATDDTDDTDASDANDATEDAVPWSRLPDGDRIGRTDGNPTGCDTFDTLLPC